MRVVATAKYIRISPRKVRLVTDLITGKPVEEAAAILRFLPNAAARDVAKVLKSATANAENNFNLSADELNVLSATANEGPTLKRWRPRARGRATRIRKRTCHVTLVLAEVPEQNTGRRRRKQAETPGAEETKPKATRSRKKKEAVA